MATHTKTTLDPLRQGIEIQGVVEDDFGNLVPGPHELQGEVNGIPIPIAYVGNGGMTCGMDDLPDVQISAEEQISNLNRLALCWNCHDELVAALEAAADQLDARCPGLGHEARKLAAKAKG